MLGIIGGSGLYNFDGVEEISQEVVDTPFGSTSAPISLVKAGGREIAFLPRHGLSHNFLPSEINYRANIFALKTLGVRRILGVSAVGSLQEDLTPGMFVLPNQYIDLTKGLRNSTFFGNGIAAHISTAEPVCSLLSEDVVNAAKKCEISIARNKTYACIEGPRLGTRAESLMLKKLGADLVGMTNVPESFLVREAQICYASLCVVTDYDSWMDDPSQHASVEVFLARYKENIEKVKRIILEFTSGSGNDRDCTCRNSLKTAILTPEDGLTEHQKEIMNVLRR